MADIQVNLQPKGDRKLQSHAIAKQVRQRLLPVAEQFGPASRWPRCRPVRRCSKPWWPKSTVPNSTSESPSRAASAISGRAPGVVDVDWYVEDDQPEYRLIVDKEKAALNGVSEEEIAATLALASSGETAGLLHVDSAKEDVPITVRLGRASRSDLRTSRTSKSPGATDGW